MSTNSPLDAIRSMLSDYFSIDLTADQTVRLFRDQYALLGEVMEWGAEDTCCREKVVRVLAMQFVGRDWPMIRDGDAAAQAFNRDLKAALDSRGIAHRLT